MNSEQLFDLLYKLALLTLPEIVREELIFPEHSQDALAKLSYEIVAMIDWYRRLHEASQEEKKPSPHDLPVVKKLETQISQFMSRILPFLLLDDHHKEREKIEKSLHQLEQHENDFQHYKKKAKESREQNPQDPTLATLENHAFHEIEAMGNIIQEICALFFSNATLINPQPLNSKIKNSHSLTVETAAQKAALTIFEKGSNIIVPGRRIRKMDARTVPGLQLCRRSFWIDQDKIFVIDQGSKLQAIPSGNFAKGKNALVYHSNSHRLTLAYTFMKASKNIQSARLAARHEHAILVKLGRSLGGGERLESAEEKIHSSYDEFQEKYASYDLETYINKTLLTPKKSWDIPELIAILKGCAQELDMLHLHDILHCDIKLDNFTYNPSNRTIKIIDFGLAIDFDNPNYPSLMKKIRGAYAFLAPEIKNDFVTRQKNPELSQDAPYEYSSASDIYSLGLAFGLACGFFYFVSEEKIALGPRQLITTLLKKIDPDSYKELHRLIMGMVSNDPSKRPTLPELLYSLDQLPALAQLQPSPTPRHFHPKFS